ncbi:MAG: hypothetical protein ACFFE8_14760 [Candidatus Heimdallarchaeota archaeon]
MATNEEKERSYHDLLEELYDGIIHLHGSLYEPDEQYSRLVAIEESLETVLNWIKLEKNSLRNYEIMVEWTKKLALNTTLTTADIRNRLRVMVLPQAESFIQNLITGERSALKVLEAVTKNLEELPFFLKSVKDQNFKLLQAIGYDPEAETSYLETALYNLVIGRLMEFEKSIELLRTSAKQSTQISRDIL